MTPKIRFKPSASSASRPASKSPLRIASRKKMSSWQSITISQPSFIRSNPHVRLADLVARGEFLRAAARLQPPDLEQVGAVRNFQHLAHVLLDDQHRVAFRADAAHQVEYLRDDHGRESHRGLVQQYELRPAHQR